MIIKEAWIRSVGLFTTFIIIIFTAACSSTPPEITTTPPDSPLQPGERYIYEAKATGTEPIKFSKNKGPDNLSIQNSTGVVRWKTSENTQPKKYPVEIEAVNDAGSDQQSWKITIKRSKLYDKGRELGRRLWNKDFGLTKVLNRLVKKDPSFLESGSLREGMISGYKEGIENDKIDESMLKDNVTEFISNLLEAAKQKKIFQNGKKIGNNLIKRDVAISNVIKRKREVSLKGKPKRLAWRAGFIMGYTGGKDKLMQSAINLYNGLGK